MEAKNVASINVAPDRISTHLESLENSGEESGKSFTSSVKDCFCIPGAIAVLMEYNSTCHCCSSIHEKRSILIFNETFDIIAKTERWGHNVQTADFDVFVIRGTEDIEEEDEIVSIEIDEKNNGFLVDFGHHNIGKILVEFVT